MSTPGLCIACSIINCTINHSHQCCNKNRSKNNLIVFCQPVGQEYVKIFLFGIGVIPGHQSQRTGHFKNQKGQTFPYYQCNAYPREDIHRIRNPGIQHIKDNGNKKYPNHRMNQLDSEELFFWRHD